MGNHHHTGRHHPCLPKSPLRGFHFSFSESDTDSDCDENHTVARASEKLHEAIMNNDVENLKDLMNNNNDIDLNAPMNSKDESALMMSVKLSHLDMVNTLLAFPNCNNNSHNMYHFSVLDAALITLFDRRETLDSEQCWKILTLLLRAKSEPLSKDAMTYVIRTALKFKEVSFIMRLIDTVTVESHSTTVHLYLLEKLHRHQPIYPDDMDPILQQMTNFTISLLRSASPLDLQKIVPSMEYYLESYWKCREKKDRVLQHLVVYATAAGWNWSHHEIISIERASPSLALWCCRCKAAPASLVHLCRLTFRSHVTTSVSQSITNLPSHFPTLLKNFILLHDVDSLPHRLLDLDL